MSAMEPAILTYWDGRGNAELIRLSLVVAGRAYKEQVFLNDEKTHMDSKADMLAIMDKGVLAFDQLPLLQIDGLFLVQKLAIMRYIARKHALYGSNEIEAIQIDMVVEGILDFKGKLKGDEASFYDAMDNYGPKFERILRTNTTSNFLIGKNCSFADILLADAFLTYKDKFPQLRMEKYPGCNALLNAFISLPQVASYLASDKRYPIPGREGYFARVKDTIPWVFEGTGVPRPPTSCETWNFKK